MGGNKINSLGEPTEATDAINRSILHKRLTATAANVKTDFTATFWLY